MDIKVSLNIPDCHIPYENHDSYELMLFCAKDIDKKYGLDQVNILGDYLDFNAVKFHPKMPFEMSLKETFKDELYKGNQRLKELRKLFPNTEINFVEGNHEFRFVRFLVKKIPELFDLYTLPELLKFDEWGINYIPYEKRQLHRVLDTDLFCRHEPFSSSTHCAAMTLKMGHINLLFGHTHRMQRVTQKNALGKEITAISGGFLGDTSSPIFEFAKNDDWVQGFSFTWSYDDEWWTDLVHIKDNRFVYGGVLYEI